MSQLRDLLFSLAQERANDFSGTANTRTRQEQERRMFLDALRKQTREDDVMIEELERERFEPTQERIKTGVARQQVKQLGQSVANLIQDGKISRANVVLSRIVKIVESSNITPLFREQLTTFADSGIKSLGKRVGKGVKYTSKTKFQQIKDLINTPDLPRKRRDAPPADPPADPPARRPRVARRPPAQTTPGVPTPRGRSTEPRSRVSMSPMTLTTDSPLVARDIAFSTPEITTPQDRLAELIQSEQVLTESLRKLRQRLDRGLIPPAQQEDVLASMEDGDLVLQDLQRARARERIEEEMTASASPAQAAATRQPRGQPAPRGRTGTRGRQ